MSDEQEEINRLEIIINNLKKEIKNKERELEELITKYQELSDIELEEIDE